MDRVDTSDPLAVDELVVLSYPQWQGADHANRQRYQAGAEAVRQEIRRLIPPERASHLQVAVSSVLEPQVDEKGPRAWSCIARQQRDAFDLLAKTAPVRAITLGGDCGVEAASIGYFNAISTGNIALLWLDSHGDLNSNAESPSGNYHGMVLRDLIEPGTFSSSLKARCLNCIYLGVVSGIVMVQY
jgi:arginase